MSATREIKRRILSVKNTRKITKAMELVSASKMRKAIAQATASKEYAHYAKEILDELDTTISHPFIATGDRDHQQVLLVAIGSNKGLCGAYNARVAKTLREQIRHHKSQGRTVVGFAIGKKMESVFVHEHIEIVGAETGFNDQPTLNDMHAFISFILDYFSRNECDLVEVVSTDFISVLSYAPKSERLLPIRISELDTHIQEIGKNQDQPEPKTLPHKFTLGTTEFDYEPSQHELVHHMLPTLVRMRLYQMVIESVASEHSARMMAMKTASESAGEMIDNLTLAFNKARQAAITQEISEISAGMTSLQT